MFANLTIARKLLIGFLVIIVAFVAAAAFVAVSLADADHATARVRNSKDGAEAARAAWHSFVVEQNAVRGFVISQSEKMLADIAQQRDQYVADLQHLREVESDAVLLDKIGAADRLIREWRTSSADKQVALARDPATRPQAFAFVNGQFASGIRALLDEVIAAEDAVTARYSAAQDRASARVNWVLACAGSVMLMLAGFFWWLLTRSIAAPMRTITAALDRLAQGETGFESPVLGRTDEIGRFAASVRLFADAALEKHRLEAEATEVRRQADSAREVGEQERAQAAALQGEVVAQLGTGLARLSEGDLTVRLEGAFAPEYEQLRADFNAALDELHAAMRVIVTSTTGLRSGTQEITVAADDLSRRTEREAASLEETAAALGEITSAVRRTADGAGRARDSVADARSDAERSGSIVQEAVGAMGEIERSAAQISQIIGVIDEIAFQTNLLALNAGVEAARAGDAGRGFAVVASEVRALAQRSAEAAKEIKALISASTQLVGRGVALVDQTGKSLSRIVSQVAEMDGIVAGIAASANEQATGLNEINTALNQMDQVTQQNAAMVQQTTAASHALAHEAAELASLTSRFRLAETPEATQVRSETRPATQPRAKAARTRPAALAYSTEGATALVAHGADADDDWEEF